MSLLPRCRGIAAAGRPVQPQNALPGRNPEFLEQPLNRAGRFHAARPARPWATIILVMDRNNSGIVPFPARP
ncbi:hypothetical protein DY926_11190 [Komagataeibacter melaceti]|uniref:Uncharacterized protein n=1 Tax=Komagataeibacter melaceti TaxID=2766577 RepID=A0A371YYZ4_9PROT|nr:hypothetical protein DY926_11190 [Komagataeibacter melaceti]